MIFLDKYKNLPTEKKAEIKSRSFSFGGKIAYIVWGIPIGWMLCHYYVGLYNGIYPTQSTLQFIFDLTNNIWNLLTILGIGSIPAIFALYSAFKKNRRTSDNTNGG